MFRSAQIKITLLNVNSSILSLSVLFFISFAKKKQTNKQTERTLAGTPQQLWPITAGPDTNKKNLKKEILKNKVIQEKLQLHTTSYLTRQGTSTITF